MGIVLRAFLTSLAVMSLVVFGGPASAGMVSTPSGDRRTEEAREEVLKILRARLLEAGPRAQFVLEEMKTMSTSRLLALAESAGAEGRAGFYHLFIAYLVLVGFVVICGLCGIAYYVIEDLTR